MDHGHGGERIAHSDPNNPFHIKHPSLMLFLQTYLMLLGLLFITVWLYTRDLNQYTGWIGTNIVIAMTVAVIKAALVVRNFMNVKNGTRLVFLWAVIGFIWLTLMIGVFMDYNTRHWVDQSGWQPLTYQEPPGGMPRQTHH